MIASAPRGLTVRLQFAEMTPRAAPAELGERAPEPLPARTNHLIPAPGPLAK